MCGQGLMLGPGTGELVARMIADQTSADDQLVLEEFSPYRKFERQEVLK
jgi:sarcosine oxidase subunit beta